MRFPENLETAKSPFKFHNKGLLYSVDDITGKKPLCIPRRVQKKVFKIAHGYYGHEGVQKLIDRVKGFCIPKLNKQVKEFVSARNGEALTR